MLSGVDRDHAAGESRGQASEDTGALCIAERRSGGQIETELHARVARVDALTARSGRMGEPFDQLTRWHSDPLGRTRARRNEQVGHVLSLPQASRGSGPGVRRGGA